MRSTRSATSPAASSNRAGAVGSRGGGPGGGLSGVIGAKPRGGGGPYPHCMSPFWIWMQAAVVVTVLAGMVIAIVKLA